METPDIYEWDLLANTNPNCLQKTAKLLILCCVNDLKKTNSWYGVFSNTLKGKSKTLLVHLDNSKVTLHVKVNIIFTI